MMESLKRGLVRRAKRETLVTLARFFAVLLLALPLVTVMTARAQSPDAALNEKLAKYDPAAVKAALHYLETFNMKSVLAQSIGPMRDAIVRTVKEKNPDVDDATLREFVEVFLKVVYVDHASFLENSSVVMILDIFTTEEIVAIDQFYSSDVGRSVIQKMPQFMARLPELLMVMQKEIVPVALEEAQKALKAKGKNIRM